MNNLNLHIFDYELTFWGLKQRLDIILVVPLLGASLGSDL